MNTCNQTIGFQDLHKTETSGRGFAKRTVCIYTCKACGAETKLRKNWHGPTPNGGIRCGAVIAETVSA